MPGKWLIRKKYIFFRHLAKMDQVLRYFRNFLINFLNNVKFMKNKKKGNDLNMKKN